MGPKTCILNRKDFLRIFENIIKVFPFTTRFSCVRDLIVLSLKLRKTIIYILDKTVVGGILLIVCFSSSSFSKVNYRLYGFTSILFFSFADPRSEYFFSHIIRRSIALIFFYRNVCLATCTTVQKPCTTIVYVGLGKCFFRFNFNRNTTKLSKALEAYISWTTKNVTFNVKYRYFHCRKIQTTIFVRPPLRRLRCNTDNKIQYLSRQLLCTLYLSIVISYLFSGML